MSYIHTQNDDPMVIIIKCDELDIRRVSVHHESSIDILYWDMFEMFLFDLDDLKVFKGSVIGFYVEQIK